MSLWPKRCKIDLVGRASMVWVTIYPAAGSQLAVCVAFSEAFTPTIAHGCPGCLPVTKEEHCFAFVPMHLHMAQQCALVVEQDGKTSHQVRCTILLRWKFSRAGNYMDVRPYTLHLAESTTLFLDQTMSAPMLTCEGYGPDSISAKLSCAVLMQRCQAPTITLCAGRQRFCCQVQGLLSIWKQG